MKYVKNPSKLTDVVKTLALHKEDAKQYYLAELKPRLLGIAKAEDKLCMLFTIANADRQGTGANNESLRIATATFKKCLGKVLDKCKGMEPGSAHKYFLTYLCDIEGMNQKTANLFLKYLAMLQDEFELTLLDWHSWESYLHVPLDRWVLRLMSKNHLSVCGNNFEEDFQDKRNRQKYISPLFKEGKYRSLQDDLAEVALLAQEPAITLDILWFVGNKYCNYHPLLCEVCWLREDCCNCEIIDWGVVSTKLKSEKEKERKEQNKSIRKMVRVAQDQWLSENLGKNPSDFYGFMKQEAGKDWLRRFLSHP